MLSDTETRNLIRQELASLGGHLLAQANTDMATLEQANTQDELDALPAYQTSRAIQSFGGYLLSHYGDERVDGGA